MDRWTGKVALITGGASGIGAQICRDLCLHRITVYALDSNVQYLDQLSCEMHDNPEFAGRFLTIYCDVTEEEQLQVAFEKITQECGGVDILVNCAGIITTTSILEDGGEERLLKVFQTNVLATISCIKRAYQSMCARDAEGHIVNLCSVTGHCVPPPSGVKPCASGYYVSKFAVNALNRVINQELIYFDKPKIRISNISPGLVGGTNIGKGTAFDEVLKSGQLLQPKDISDAAIFILSAPSHVQVREIIMESVGGMMY